MRSAAVRRAPRRSRAPAACLETIQRTCDSQRLYGVVVAESDALLLVHQGLDFLFDGCVVIRREDVTARARSDANDRTAAIMRQEGLWRRPPAPARGADVSTWAKLLGGLLGKVVILEDERTGDLWIGPLRRVEARAARIHYLNATGQWGEVEGAVPFTRLTRGALRRPLLDDERPPPAAAALRGAAADTTLPTSTAPGPRLT